MRCLIANWISFRLDDAAGEAQARQIVDERLADQVLGKFERVGGQFRPPQSSNAVRTLYEFLAHLDQFTGLTVSSKVKNPSVRVGWIYTALFKRVYGRFASIRV